MSCCALAAGRGGQAGGGPEPAVAGRPAGPAEHFDILRCGSAGYGLKELHRGKRRNHGFPVARSAFARVPFGAGFAVRTLWPATPAVLALWLLGFVTHATSVGDGRGPG
ncbi:hypothetical protein GCM10010317_064580 [Streptomyces mirabilis]|nr:hypothetical protein GCM10010317_064580 [Streptomyces mirabilis]